MIAARRGAIVEGWRRSTGIDASLAAAVADGVAISIAGELSTLDVLVPHLSGRDAVELGAFRSIVVQQLIAALPPAPAAEAAASVNVAVDRLLERARAEELTRLEHAAFTDVLTGSGNRRALERELPQWVAAATRRDETVALVVVDLDGLKAINDEHGHHAGDEALCRLAAGLAGDARGSDGVYRLGGDEFVVVMPATDREHAERVMERLADGLPSFTFGIAIAPDEGIEVETLVERADRRLLAAKAALHRRSRPAAVESPRQRPRVELAGAGLALVAAALAVSIGGLRHGPDALLETSIAALAAALAVGVGSSMPRPHLRLAPVVAPLVAVSALGVLAVNAWRDSAERLMPLVDVVAARLAEVMPSEAVAGTAVTPRRTDRRPEPARMPDAPATSAAPVATAPAEEPSVPEVAVRAVAVRRPIAPRAAVRAAPHGAPCACAPVAPVATPPTTGTAPPSAPEPPAPTRIDAPPAPANVFGVPLPSPPHRVVVVETPVVPDDVFGMRLPRHPGA